MSCIKLLHGDCLDYLKKFRDNYFDLILTDPPYNISSEVKITRTRNTMKFKATTDLIMDMGEWDKFDSEKDYWNFTYSWIDECVRVLRNGGMFITYFDRDKINFVSYYLQKKYNFKCKGYFAHIKSNPVPQARKCLEENTFLFIKRNKTYKFIKIKDIEVGDLILTPNGMSKIIGKRLSSKKVGKKILLNSGDYIILTKDHLLYTFKEGKIKETKAEELKKGDYIFCRLFNDIINLPEGNEESYKKGKFIGLYLAEGSKSIVKTNNQKIRTAQLAFHFHREEDKLKNFVIGFAKQLGFNSSIYQHKDKQCDSVIISNYEAVKWMEKYVEGNNAKNKKLTDLVFNEDKKFLEGIIDGYFLGDGWFLRNVRNFVTSSLELAQQLNLILLILGKWSIKKTKISKGFGKIYGKHYEFKIPLYEDEKRTPLTRGIFYKYPILNFNFTEDEIIDRKLRYMLKHKKQKWSDIRILQKQVKRNLKDFFHYSLLKIVQIEDIEGIFYDIEIEDIEGKFLISNGILTHNCKWMNSWEIVGLWQKPNGKLTYNYWLGQHPDYIIVPIVGGKERLKHPNRAGALHPTQKPLEVVKLFIKYWTNEGDKILDPFAGTGTTLIGAYLLNRHCIGIEKDDLFYKEALKRIEKYTKQKRLF